MNFGLPIIRTATPPAGQQCYRLKTLANVEKCLFCLILFIYTFELIYTGREYAYQNQVCFRISLTIELQSKWHFTAGTNDGAEWFPHPESQVQAPYEAGQRRPFKSQATEIP